MHGNNSSGVLRHIRANQTEGMKIMATNNWSATANDDVDYFSDDALEMMEDLILRNQMEAGYDFCDCENADTGWTITAVAVSDSTVTLSLESYGGAEAFITYFKTTGVA